jgi:hypothetical protein
VSIPNAGVAKNQQKTGVFRGFRLEAIGRIVAYYHGKEDPQSLE